MWIYTTSIRILLTLLFGLGCTNAYGQVYAVGTHRGPMVTLRVDEHAWVVGSRTNEYGLVQYRCRANEQAPWIRYTSICLGRPLLTVRLPAILVAAIILMVASSPVWFAVVARSK